MPQSTSPTGRDRRATPAPDAPLLQADAPTLLRASDICSRLKISRSCWLAWVAAGEAPEPAIKAPRFTRWRAADVAAWVEAQSGQEA
jgi:predicted DNA-binding transcriptional regulator AlpA